MRRSDPTLLFLFLVLLSAAFYLLSRTGTLGILEKGIQPVQKSTLGIFNFLGGAGMDEKIKKIEEENMSLSKKLVDQGKLEADIEAFRNQFETESVRTDILLPAEIIGIKGFVPNVTPPEYYILDKGKEDGVKEGDAIVYKDNFIGRIERTSVFQSRVLLPTNSSLSIPAKTQNGVLGVVKGQGGGEMILDNVLLSEKISVGELVLTAPDAELDGGGTSSNLVIGKIVSIEKRSGELFQKARIRSLVDYARLNRIFILRPR